MGIQDLIMLTFDVRAANVATIVKDGSPYCPFFDRIDNVGYDLCWCDDSRAAYSSWQALGPGLMNRHCYSSDTHCPPSARETEAQSRRELSVRLQILQQFYHL